ncbi:monosaccharide ABC transporter substrate-binding protein (CUT2 family) [Microbacterium sp. AG1240]|uniref:sugar ABC transporter substrate-binding protein n=1 Tax=Microbacterium sp. AG1240 TaxID=2183992 RepID=UPI000F1075C5|nr:sugar ABC transporter substrate-binding protein [Microbacterium sp. AG1240]RKT31464.1 monosaccharide ABC transporter substrate-binding protein (CUT2 family) [Microbacterium sp. AG1240]
MAKKWLAPAIVAAAALLLAGCSGPEDDTASAPVDTSNVPAAISEIAEQGQAEITAWPGPDDSPQADGEALSVVVVPCGMAVEGCKRQAEGFIEAADALGWQTTLVDPKGDPAADNAAIDQAITQKADAVFLVSIDPDIVSGALERARAAGIFVVASATDNTTGLDHEVSLHGDAEGQMLASQIVVSTGGDAKIAMFTGNEFKTVVKRVEGSKEIFSQCSGCEIVAEQDISQTAGGADLVSLVQSTLQANPDVNVLWAPYDAAATDMVQAVQQSGRSDVIVASFNGNLQNLDFIRSGTVQKIVVGEALEWVGWAGADAVLRLSQGAAMVDDDGVPARILVADNLPAEGTAWTGDFDFRAKYSEMWGV